ncbi:MAG: hypothetical protein ACRENE_02545 [Polyangiaceae bacterium]
MKAPWLPTLALAASAIAVPSTASAEAPPSRDGGWNTATNVLAVSSLAAGALMPRVFFSDPEVTAGWKARWHLSVLAPIMTLTSLALANEVSLKGAFAAPRPGCQDSGPCDGYGLFSTPAFAASSALGNGVAVFLVDTLKWSSGNVGVGGLFGEVILPLVLAPITIIGRTAGNWESGGQAWSSGGVGLLSGLVTGFVYATLQRPECGYTGSLVCW